MQAKNIKIGSIYNLTLGRNEVQGEVIAETENGWEVRLLASEKVIKVNNPDRFIKKVRQREDAAPQLELPLRTKDHAPDGRLPLQDAILEPHNKRGRVKGQMSGLDAAARVLTEDNAKMNVRQIAEAAIERGYWSPNGATPSATISSAIQREIRDKGKNSRFIKVGKGLFATITADDECDH